MSKAEGGLGIKYFGTRHALCIVLIKSIIMKEGSIWIAWLCAYSLRTGCFWEVQANQGCSWMWKSILNLRGIASNFVMWDNGWKWNSAWKF